ncbi:unnamed protein product [Citrullus colocynthis]|uniref:Uncharacterized protein n=1 Tax=Citrullus colocynthis TaxID=252529 RepID=A0ABP0XUL3_9ROSI
MVTVKVTLSHFPSRSRCLLLSLLLWRTTQDHTSTTSAHDAITALDDDGNPTRSDMFPTTTPHHCRPRENGRRAFDDDVVQKPRVVLFFGIETTCEFEALVTRLGRTTFLSFSTSFVDPLSDWPQISLPSTHKVQFCKKLFARSFADSKVIVLVLLVKTESSKRP